MRLPPDLRNPIPVVAAILFVLLEPLHGADGGVPVVTNGIATPIPIPGLQNTFRVTDRIYSGSQPDSDAAFEALAALGVRTIVSVDGSKPDVERAHRFGIRYIHLPFGYDGVPPNRVAQLARVPRLTEGPIYVHCHHGMHRGPTAVAVMCEADDGWTPAQAVAWLHEAGTAADYPGLYRSAREFKKPNQEQLDAATEFPEVAQTSTLVDTMVAIDEHFSWLKRSQKAGWKMPAGHPDLTPAHEATMLWELIREIPRNLDLGDRPEDFRRKLGAAERAADQLRRVLAGSADGPAMDTAFSESDQSCAACHRSYRNQ